MCPIIGLSAGEVHYYFNSFIAFFPGFHALCGEFFSWRVANVNVNKQCFHLTGSLNSGSDALSGLHRVFFQQFSPGGSCPPHYGAFSPGLAKLKDQARAWFFSALTLFSSKGLSVRLVQVRTGCLQSQAAILTAGASRMFTMVSVRHSQLGALPILRSYHILSAISEFYEFSRRRRLHKRFLVFQQLLSYPGRHWTVVLACHTSRPDYVGPAGNPTVIHPCTSAGFFSIRFRFSRPTI